MGKQFAIAQSEEDERTANEWLRSRADLLCLPRLTVEPAPRPRLLGEVNSPDQVIFPAAFAEAVLKNWVSCSTKEFDGTTRYLLSAFAPAAIEWSRTAHLPGGRVVDGRYFLDTSPRRAGLGEVHRLMTSLSAWVRRTYPRRTADRPPTFIGPALEVELTRGARQLVYRNGITPMPLAEL
nr:hypothetical protein [uncultured bacterium]